MKRTIRGIAMLLACILLGGAVPLITASAATDSPFDASVISSSNGIIASTTVNGTESIGYNNEVSYYKTTIKSTGTRRDSAKAVVNPSSRRFADTFSNVNIAMGGRLFVYSMSESRMSYEPHLINDIAAQFEKDHPEWKVAIVTNATFFDNEEKKTTDKGEPEDIYIEDGKTYKTYIEKGEDGGDVFKVGRGIVGLKDDGTVIYNTIENGTSHYTGSTPYSFSTKYTLEVLGENKNNSIYDYTLLANGSFDYSNEPIFITPTMAAKDLRGATVYKVKCTDYRRSHVGVNGREVGDKTYYFEGVIESISAGTTSMKPAEGYVYLASYAPLEHLKVGVTVRGTRKMTGEWANASYVFGYKQQILHEGAVLFDGSHQESYGAAIHGSWDNTWSEDLSYATYGSNRTAVGFKADGTPVIITMPRKLYLDKDGVTVLADTSATYSEMAWYMKSLGCVNAFMMDCGGSTGMYKKSTGSDTYTVTCHEPKWTYPSRPVSTALILAYPSGESANPTDETLADPNYKPGYITTEMNTPWYSGVTKFRTTADVKNSSKDNFNTNSTLTKTNFKLAQNGTIYTFTPTSTAFASGYEAVYAYKKLGFKVEEGKKYTYCFKLNTVTAGKYTSFLFGELPSNTASSKMLNNFAVVGGAFTNNGDTQYSDVRVGYGRVQLNTSDVIGVNQNINLFLETVSGKKYSYYRIDIDGLNYTLKVKDSTGAWTQIGGTYSLASGTDLVMGCASWETNTARAMSVCDPVCVDVTNLSNGISAVGALNGEEYTASSWAPVAKANEKAGYSINLTNQALIDYASTQLNTSMSGLVKRMDIADANIADFNAANSALYTVDSWAAYQSAYNAIVEAKNANNLAALDVLNDAYVTAKNALVLKPDDGEDEEDIISFDISWQTMTFTYQAADQAWNPNTHSYDAVGDAEWKAENGSNLIKIENACEIDLLVDFEYISVAGFEAISGDFYNGDTLVNNGVTLNNGATSEVSLKLKGVLPANTADNTKSGTVKVTVTKAS